LVAYQTAWLKAHYPAAFMAAVMSSDMDNTDKVVVLIDECREMKLSICPPDINISDYRFTVNEQGQIVYGIGAIKGVGENAIDDLLSERKANGPYAGLYDLCKRVDLRKVNRRVLEALIRAGALDSIDPNRAAHLAELTTALRVAEQHGKMALAGQNDLFGLTETQSDADETEAYSLSVEPWTEKEKLEAEKQTLGLFLTGHPIAEYLPELKHITHGSLGSLEADAGRIKGKMEARVAGLIVDMRTRQTKQGKMMGFATLDDRTGRLEVAAFSGIYDKYRDLLAKDTLLVAEGSLAMDDFSNSLRMTAEKLYSMEEAREMFARGIVLTWDASQTTAPTNFVEKLTEILQPFRGGECPIIIEYTASSAKATVQLGDDWRVKPSDELLIRMRRLLSTESVLVKYKA
jgi:DNA polymerase-3 subunit alpha